MEGRQDPEKIKCHLTGYNYTTDYTCKKRKLQQADDGESLSQKDKVDSTVRSTSSVEQIDNNNHKE